MRNPDLRLYRGNYGTYRSNGNAAINAYISDTNEPQQESEPLVIFSDITTEGILKELGISVFKTKLALNDRNYTRLPRILNLLLRGYDISKIDIKEKRKIVRCYIEILTSKYAVYNRAMEDKGLIETLRERLRAQLTDKKLMHAIWPEYQIDDGQETDEELLKRYLKEKRRREGIIEEIDPDEFLLTDASKSHKRNNDTQFSIDPAEFNQGINTTTRENGFELEDISEEYATIEKIYKGEKKIISRNQSMTNLSSDQIDETATREKTTTPKKVKPVKKTKPTRVPVTPVSREDLIQSTAETNAGNGRRQKLVARLRQGVSNSDISIQEKPQNGSQFGPKKVKVVRR